MRILVTNDDGIGAPGLVAAEEIAHELAGTDGEVWTVAPAFEQSGVAHCVSYVRPMRIEKLGDYRYAVEGSPADCVLAAIGDVIPGGAPDLVLSGVNRGRNVAEDTLYSGTVGAAMEGALHGLRSIAMSQCYSPALVDAPDMFEAARARGAQVCRRLLETAPWEGDRYNPFYNVNFPPVRADAVRGAKVTFQGYRVIPTFQAEPQMAPNGRRFLWLGHGQGERPEEPGGDATEAMAGFVTVTPLRADLTAHDVAERLAGALDDL